MVLNLLFRVWLLLILAVPLTVGAADSPDKADGAPVREAAGVSDLGSRLMALSDFTVRSGERLVQLADFSKQQEAFEAIRERFARIQEEMTPLGPPADWYVDRLNNFLGQISGVDQGLAEIQQRLTARQKEVEDIRLQLAGDKDFWATWKKELTGQGLAIPKQTFAQVNEQISGLEKTVRTTTESLLAHQERIADFQRDVLLVSDSLNQAMSQVRKATFRKNAHSFFNLDFYRQFTPALLQKAREGLEKNKTFDTDYLRSNGFLLGLMAAVFLAAALGLRSYRSRFEDTDEWDFLLKHPVATAGFFSLAVFWLWLPTPPHLIRFVYQLLAAIFASILAIPLLKNRRQAGLLVLAAVIILVTYGFRLISLPQPLFRLYLCLLAVVLIPVLAHQVRLSSGSPEKADERLFRALMRLSIVVLFISFVGQIAGYVNFSAWLVQATFETGMVLLFTRMAILLFGGGIDLGVRVLSRTGMEFFDRYGSELAGRVKTLLGFFIVTLSLFYLIPVWRLFATVNEAWTFLADYSLDIGSFELTLQMLIGAVIVFYLALQVSWVVQGMTETRVFSRRSVDRGVLDAMKKLLHYGIVLIGFLVALSFLGLDLQNFVVLLGAFGVGIGFGLQDIVNNFLSGLILLFERPIKVGDGVVIDGEYGTVKHIGLRSTIVQNLDEAELIVPNAQMISQKVTNWTLSNRRVRIVLNIGVAYGSDLEKVMAILDEVAREHSEVMAYPEPVSYFVQFGASSLDFELRVWVSNIDNRPRVKNELLLEIDRRFREADVEIPFPQRDLHVRSVAPGLFTGD